MAYATVWILGQPVYMHGTEKPSSLTQIYDSLHFQLARDAVSLLYCKLPLPANLIKHKLGMAKKHATSPCS